MCSRGEELGKAAYSWKRFEAAGRDRSCLAVDNSAFLVFYSPFPPPFFLKTT